MNCENNFCIYQNNGECKIENISINSLGMCSECILPDIDETTLYKEKCKLLEKYVYKY